MSGKLRGTPSKAPCWWCSRQLQGWKGADIKLDGKPVVVHLDCLREMLRDPDFKGRTEPPAWWDEAKDA